MSKKIWINEFAYLQDFFPLQGLNYTNNSCYIDSVLFALFSIPNMVVIDQILKKTNKNEPVRLELLKIANGESKNCIRLRKLIKNISTQDFYSSNMQDAGEFLMFLTNLFDVNIAYTIETVTSVNGTLFNEIKDKHNRPIVSIPPYLIEDGQDKEMKSFLVQREYVKLDKDNVYRYKKRKYTKLIKTWEMVDSPYLIFYIHRLKTHKIRTRIIMNRKIKNLRLTAIIVHSNYHYTCYVLYNKLWYYYDDNSGNNKHKIILIGTYSSLLKNKPDPEKDGVLYFYT